MRYFGIFLCVLCLVACTKKIEQPVANPPRVNIIIVETKDVPVSFDFVAQTQSSHLVNIQARVSGFLDKKVYTEGQMVEEGDVLFIMDKKPFEVQVDAALAAVEKQKAARENALLNLNRVKPLAEQNALSQKDLDDANGAYLTSDASVKQAEANLESALLNLSYCTITSPIKGITSSAQEQEGTYLNVANSQLTTVSAMDPIWVNFSLSENQMQKYIDEVEKGILLAPQGEEFVVKVIQINGQMFPHSGKITFTEPYFNAQTGTFLIRASVANPKGILRPNQYVRASVEGAIRPHAILVPQRAVLESAKGHFVWVVDKENKVDFRPVTVGDWHGEEWFITAGLQPGDQVVVDGTVGLQAGEKVEVIDISQ